MRDDFKVLVVSTAHLRKTDIELLLKQHCEITDTHPASANIANIHLNPATDFYGFWVYSAYVEDTNVEEFEKSGFSKEMHAILECAFKEDYKYVRFDEDAQYDENWPVFQWELEGLKR